MKYINNYYEYIQSIALDCEVDYIVLHKDEIILHQASVYSSPNVLDEIVKNVILLYCLIMKKKHSVVEPTSSSIKHSYRDELQTRTI